jgi:integrase
MFNWAVSRDILERSPCDGVAPPPRVRPRERVLDDVELTKVLAVCGDDTFGRIVRLLILTGQRRGEIAALKWSYIDDKQSTITLPATITKNKRQHTFPYGQSTARILAASPQLSEYVFPARGNSEEFFSGWSKCKTRLDAECGIEPWTLHDLRRTFATNLAALGTPIHVTEKLLNHISGTTGGIVAVYQRHTYMDDMRAAIAAWDARLASLVTAST